MATHIHIYTGTRVRDARPRRRARDRKFPSYTTAQLEKFVAEGKGSAAIEEEIAARKSGASQVRVVPQITPLRAKDSAAEKELARMEAVPMAQKKLQSNKWHNRYQQLRTIVENERTAARKAGNGDAVGVPRRGARDRDGFTANSSEGELSAERSQLLRQFVAAGTSSRTRALREQLKNKLRDLEDEMESRGMPFRRSTDASGITSTIGNAGTKTASGERKPLFKPLSEEARKRIQAMALRAGSKDEDTPEVKRLRKELAESTDPSERREIREELKAAIFKQGGASKDRRAKDGTVGKAGVGSFVR